jgi:hypothetical protein
LSRSGVRGGERDLRELLGRYISVLGAHEQKEQAEEFVLY